MIDLLLEKLESDSQVFKTVVQNFFKRYAKPSCFSSEENISRNKLSETSAINTLRKMSSFLALFIYYASEASNYYYGPKFQSLPLKLRKKLVIFYKMLIRDDLRRIGIHFAQMGFAHDDWADSRV